MEEQRYSPTTPSSSKSPSPPPPPPPPSSILHKALLILAFLFLLPLFPTEAPEFLHHTPLTTSWELLHLLLVGIAISYGLFGRRTTTTDSDNHHHKDIVPHKSHPSPLQVASVFDDEDHDNYGHLLRRDVDTNNSHLWNSRYQREPPSVVLAGDDKPLCLPIRSLRSQVPKRTNNEKIADGLVLPSPIPWTTRSERLEPKLEPFPSHSPDPNGRSNSDANVSMRPRRSLNSYSSPIPPPPPPPPVPSSSSTSPTPVPSHSPDPNRRNNYDGSTLMRPRRSLTSYSSPIPPPPPPPPVPSSSSASPSPPSHSPNQNGRSNYDGSPSVRLRRSLKSNSSPVPPPPPPPPTRPLAESRRSLYPSDRFPEWRQQQPSKEPSREQEPSFPSPPAPVPEIKKLGTKEKPKMQSGSSRKFVLDSDVDSQNTSELEEDSSSDASSSVTEVETEAEEKEANEVDKKADEFIAKFREQIRLQRIASIKRSAAQHKRSSK